MPTSQLIDWTKFAYKQALRCDPIAAPTYLQALEHIAENSGLDHASLMTFLLTEKSKGYWVKSDRDKALKMLGFGDDGPLRIEFDESDVDGSFLMNAYITACNTVNTTAQLDERDAELRGLKDAVLIAAQSTGKEDLVDYVEKELQKRMRDPAQAYATLGAAREMDDEILLAVFSLRVRPAHVRRDVLAVHSLAFLPF